MAEEKRPVTVITGASSGIGRALAHEFAAHGHELVLVARREEALTAVADAIAAKGVRRPTVLRLDVGRIDAARDLSEALATRGLDPEILVNNAGFALLGAADRLDRGEQLAMLDLNVRALTDMCLIFADSIERRRGGILNVASIAGFMPGPHMAVYYASKAYVLSLTEAIAAETAGEGVRVCALAPGPVRTAWHDRAGAGNAVYRYLLPASAEAVARAGYAGYVLGLRVIVPGLLSPILAFFLRALPHRMTTPLVSWLLKPR